MPVYKDKKNNTWYVKGRYKDWTGKNQEPDEAWFCSEAGGRGMGGEFPFAAGLQPGHEFCRLLPDL